ncbi:uncharacterized protein LOC131071677 isoform X2 [Cryptomeria japonica]|uniref:uncharacterized protein LOC131071677 isoform X2 n=1 Tax=Cryptomeria japonica TaxID=3369 RepID=UPI0027DA3A63|nr:uncharacterized protein LOC131071677 isoform X2 [Cryptomeria japonica]
MDFRKLERFCRTGPDYRLATVKEAKANLEWIKRNNLLEKWDRARLLDGWIGGAGYDFNVQVGFRSCLGYMLVVETPTPEISNTGNSDPALYSNVPLSNEGRSAALFLCCEDWNYEVLHWLIEGHKDQDRSWSWGIADETEAASKLVSAVARELHGVCEKSRVPESEFSCASMRALTITIQDSVRDKIGNDILSKALLSTELLDIGDRCWEDMGLTEDLKRFRELAFNRGEELSWEDVGDSVCCFAADVMAVVIVRECCKLLMRPLAERKRMDDHAFVASVIAYGHEHLSRKFSGTDNLGKLVEAAAKEAAGSCKRFIEIFRDQGYGTFSYNGKSVVVNTFLVQAAKKGDVNLVKRFIESGVKPSETDDKRGETALHHAAKLDDESKGLEIAEMLLKKERLANAFDSKMRTPLHRAAFCGHARMCSLLLLNNANMSSRDKNGQTPLHHALGREQQNEEVVRVLIDAKTDDGVEEDARLVDSKDKNGKTPLDFAVECQDTNVRMVAWLLSQSREPQSYFKNLNLSLYLRESSRKGYQPLVEELLKEGANPLDPDNEGKTSFHYAAEGADDSVAWNIISVCGVNEELVKARDKYGRNVLHVAAFLGHKYLCSKLLEQIPNIDTKDRDGQSAIYYAVAGSHDNNEVLDIFIFGAQGTSQVFLKDDRETTPLHLAAERGNLKMVEKLLSDRAISRKKRINYVGAPDVLGQTALHKAAGGGHKKIVKKLLDEGAQPLRERDCDGKTVLHFASQAKNGKNAEAIAKLLLESFESDKQKGDGCKSDKEKILLLYASAVGIGSAEKSSSPNSPLRTYLVNRRNELLGSRGENNLNLLRLAATLGNIDMTSELLTRGANIALIRSRKWIDSLSEEEKKNVEYVLMQIDNIVEQGTDKPALSDNLGRGAFANGLAALFLNPFVKSPITVGISGEWEMGKSSLMVQTESILIKTAAQSAFSYSFHKEDFPGARESKLSAIGETRCKKIADALESLQTKKSIERESKPVWKWLEAKWRDGLAIIQKIGMSMKTGNGNSTAKGTDPLYDFLGNYQPRYHDIFKSLAVMDRRDMFEAEEESGSRNQRTGVVPWEDDSMQGITSSILTVHYNAWQYRNESEAWAGLAVEVTKELEATMTVAQKLRTSWRYNWTTRRNSICFGLILPCFLAAFLVIWLTTIVWLLLDRAQNKDIQKFKYGSLPAFVIVLVWAVVKSVVSALKPISAQIVDYICLPDHRQQLGYHQKVIFDINFLKDELSSRPSWLWKVFAFIWCCITFTRDGNYVAKTLIPKMPPAFKDNLRIVVFVDALDRCQENVILQILSAVNMVLAACEIDVILGMDKSMIEKAIIRKFGDKNSKPNESSQDLADKYLRKIIQLPLDLPDPSNSESQHFLQGQLGMSDTRKGTTDSEAQNERPNTYGHRKLNPKFTMGTSIPTKTKLAEEKTRNFQAETGIKQEITHDIKDTTQKGFQHMEQEETIGKPVEGTKTDNGLRWNDILNIVSAIGKFLNPRRRNQRKLSTSEKAEGNDIEQAAGENDQNAGVREIDRNASVQKQQEETESERRLMDLSPITTEMLIPKYTEGEKNAFCFLHARSTRSRKLPRKWKWLLTYHRLAWNILSKSPEVIPLEGWQVQLIAWVFVCWQWKHLITTLVQNWHDLGVLRKSVTVNDIQKGEVAEENSGPSLREIVEHYIDERWPADKNSDSFQGDIATKKKEDTIISEVDKKSGSLPTRSTPKDEDSRREDYLKDMIRKVLKEEREKKRGYSLKIKGLQSSKKGKEKHKEREDCLKLAIKKVLQEEKDVEDMLKVIIKKVFKEEEREKQLRDSSISCEEENKGESSLQQGTTVKENQKARKSRKSKAKDEEEEREEWRKLRETLSRYNVSMDGIQAFQNFRFYCEPGHLPWPLPKHA